MAHVEVAYRFAPGTLVKLYAVSPYGHLQLRPVGQPIESQQVGDDGVVRFAAVLPTGGKYLVAGLLDGVPYTARCRAVADDQIVPQPVVPDRPGRVVAPDRTPTLETDRLRQEDVAPGTMQASDTQTGVAAPLS